MEVEQDAEIPERVGVVAVIAGAFGTVADEAKVNKVYRRGCGVAFFDIFSGCLLQDRADVVKVGLQYVQPRSTARTLRRRLRHLPQPCRLTRRTWLLSMSCLPPR